MKIISTMLASNTELKNDSIEAFEKELANCLGCIQNLDGWPNEVIDIKYTTSIIPENASNYSFIVREALIIYKHEEEE